MIGAIVAIGMVITLVFGAPLMTEHWCDGAYQRWQIHDNYRGGGCADITPAWQAILPWNHHDTDLVCLGLCGDAPMWTPEDAAP